MQIRPIHSARPLLIVASLLALLSAHCGDDSGSDSTNVPDTGTKASDSGVKSDAATNASIDASLHDSGTSTGTPADAATGSTPADATVGFDAASTHEDAAAGDAAVVADAGSDTSPTDAAVPHDAAVVADAGGDTSPTDAAIARDAAVVADAGSDTIPTLNNCAAADYADKSGANDSREIAFGAGNGFHYVPPCIIIARGQTVTFSGSFTSHPLAPGSIGNPTAGSPNSPIMSTTSGTTAGFTFPNAGTYPYICTAHAMSQGMVGSIHVR